MVAAEKINLLYVITKLELGGAQKHVLDLIRGVDQDKFRVFLFSAQDGLLVEEALHIPGVAFYRSPFLERAIHPLKDFLAFFDLYHFLGRNKIQVVHTHSSKAGILGRLAAKAAGIKVIIHTVHGWSFHEHQPKVVYYFYLWLEKVCAKFTSKFIVVSEWDKKKGLENSISSEDRYTLIRCAVKDPDFRHDKMRHGTRKSLGLGESDLVVGMVACLKPQKAPLDFIKLAYAVRQDVPHVKFVLVGDGSLRPEMLRQIKDMGLESVVTLLGWRQDIHFVLSTFDVFVLTSLWEGLPLSVLEAMGCGIPVVATDTGGVRDIISDGENGYLVQPGDIASLRDRVKALLNDARLRGVFAERSFCRIKDGEFSFQHMIQSVERVYGDALAGSAHA